VLANVEFHAGRPWPFDVALWDLAGHIHDEPVWSLAGGRASRLRAYASTGVHRTADEMVDVAHAALARGFGALKVRCDLAVVRAIRDSVGDTLELMVDCNQGWRMPWDTRPAWDVDHATEVATALAAEQVYWVEEPLHRGDYEGHAELRRRVAVRIAGGELTREPYEFRELLARDCLDVFQPDCVTTHGLTGLRRLAVDVVAAGRTFSPHTWGNGIGLLANAHLAAGSVGADGVAFLEFPFDPPEWTPARRDFVLTTPIEIDGDGWIDLGERPGLGVTLDDEALCRTASATATFN
jgi:L-alanine-DL-glutamate epimerase-like enolase superfamily enzyme